MDRRHESASLWVATSNPPAFPELHTSLHVDVAVIGGGITGITAAHLLKRAGKRVALIERDRCGRGETGHTTAHLTAVTDISLSRLVEEFGAAGARTVWDAGFSAIARVRANVRDERINCHFRWVPGVLHASADADHPRADREMRHEAAVARDLGIDAAFATRVPGIGRPGVIFKNQARFHPLVYLEVLASRIPGKGSQVFEGSTVVGFDHDRMAIAVGRHTVTADYVIVATHAPLDLVAGEFGTSGFGANLRTHRTNAVSGVAPCGDLAEGLYWEHTATGRDYLRVDRYDDHDEVVVGGGDHDADEIVDADRPLSALEVQLRALAPGVRLTHRWSSRVLKTCDDLPFAGEIRPRVFMATGYAGNGTTFGTLAGMMAADAALGRQNAWAQMFDLSGRERRSLADDTPSRASESDLTTAVLDGSAPVF